MFVLIVGRDLERRSELAETLAQLGLEWKVEWVGETAEAMALLEGRGVDVIAVDGGEARGVDLLRRAREKHPQAVRLLLLPPGAEPSASAIDIAHRHLGLPLQAGALVEAVEGIGELFEVLDNPDLKAKVGAIAQLPPAPDTYLAISKALADPNVGAAQVVQMLSRDPALVAKVLRVCNSAFFSGGRPVADLKAAVVRLGLETLRRVVLAAEALSANNGPEAEAIRRRAFFASQLAGRLLPGPSAEMASTAALLAELGRLLPGFRDARGGDGQASYADAGAWLLGLWGLPMPIVEGVAFHLQPARSRQRGFWIPGAVHVAHALVGGIALDEAWLDAAGLRDKLPEWQRLAGKLADLETA
ncbi:HDOD domain-containing protein [Silanimonas lenta]|uniref:HDOD domain-containing protein n=1 Tax=Silanimonas lenta TaxID=265429 RepID=UPI002FE305D2